MSENNPKTTKQAGEETTSCHSCGSIKGSRKRWEDNRHCKIVDKAIELVKTGSPAEDVTKLSTWLGRAGFLDSLRAGLHDADYVDPYTGLLYSSHFYDPDTEENYLRKTDPTAKTEALRHFKESLAKRYKTPDAFRNIAYELGLALHYLTDLSQPMHAANFINNPLFGDFRHEWMEAYADQNVNDFNAVNYRKPTAIDEQLANVDSIETLVKELARHSKGVFNRLVQPLLHTMESINTGIPVYMNRWGSPPDNREKTNLILWESIPQGEQVAAAFLLLWVRGYETILEQLYQRFFGRAPDSKGQQNYINHLVNDNYTVRDIVREMASSPEYYEHNRGVAAVKKTTAREVLFDDVFNEKKPRPEQQPTEAEMNPKELNHAKWFALVQKMVRSEEYSRRFGDHQIPGYLRISMLKSPW